MKILHVIKDPHQANCFSSSNSYAFQSSNVTTFLTSSKDVAPVAKFSRNEPLESRIKHYFLNSTSKIYPAHTEISKCVSIRIKCTRIWVERRIWKVNGMELKWNFSNGYSKYRTFESVYIKLYETDNSLLNQQIKNSLVRNGSLWIFSGKLRGGEI